MKTTNRKQISNLEECKQKINNLLSKYNCYLISPEEWSRVLLVDDDTQESVLAQRNK